MSHQTGIQSSESLRQWFTKCKDGKIRLLKISIENEQLIPECHLDATNSSWDHVYDALILPLIADEQPCYILFRLDTKNSSGFEWLLISWCPDDSPIRQKMLYSSTKATLRTEFGSAQIAHELHGTTKGDVNMEGYLRHKKSRCSPPPLTPNEQERHDIKVSEITTTDFGVGSKQTMGGLNFPIRPAVKQAVLDMLNGSYDYIQLAIDIEKEEIDVVCADNVRIDKLPSRIPSTHARYHVYKYKHTHEGDFMESFVFIYSMPGYKCPIKERTLYSSGKVSLTDTLASWGVEIVRKLEIDSGSELTDKFLYDEIHPTIHLSRLKFDKPKPPVTRAQKRTVIKPKDA